MGIAEVEAGLQAIDHVIKIYDKINPGVKGQVLVLNKLKDWVTVRAYNNNDWLMTICLSETKLAPGGQGYVTAATDPVKLYWKRGQIEPLQFLGKKCGTSVVPKTGDVVWVIDDTITP